MKESRQEHPRKAKGNRSALKGSQQNAINGKRKDSADEETRVVSATMRTNGANQIDRPLLLQNRRRKTIGHILRKDLKTVQRLISHTKFKRAAHLFTRINQSKS